jgi:hypothetical protein
VRAGVLAAGVYAAAARAIFGAMSGHPASPCTSVNVALAEHVGQRKLENVVVGERPSLCRVTCSPSTLMPPPGKRTVASINLRKRSRGSTVDSFAAQCASPC